MSDVRAYTRSFGGGELSEEMFGRVDDAKFQTGLATCTNIIVYPHGPVANRSGSKFVRAVKDSTKQTRVIPFKYSTSQALSVEVGAGYFRFHVAGATLSPGSPAAYNGATAYVVGDLVSSVGVNYYCIAATTGNAPPNATYWYAMPSGIYEIPNPYAESDLFSLKYTQSADVLTISHIGYATRELRRYGATNWQLATSSFAPDLSAPGSVTATASAVDTTTTYSYKVTAISSKESNESLVSSAATCTNNLLTSGRYNTVAWGAVTGAVRYNVYKQSNGLYGFIGQTDATTFKDDNINADVSKTPPIENTPFSGAGNNPGAVGYFDGRKVFAGTTNAPQNFWTTVSGTEKNLNYHIPTRDDDAISIRIASREADTLRHIVPLNDLLILGASAEWKITPVNSDVLTPTTCAPKAQSYIGSSDVTPALVGESVVYAASRGGHVWTIGYALQAGGYKSSDLCLRAPHLFDRKSIVDMSYAKSPYPIVWCVSSSGLLLGLTYIPDQEVLAWHKHSTATEAGTSVIESCCVVPEGSADVLYLVVKRVINGSTVRYIECIGDRGFDALEDAFFVDCGLTYDGAPADVISGLSHLEGETVSILADGSVHPQKVVTGGVVTLDYEASVVQIGLPITADLKTLPVSLNIPGFAQGRVKNVNEVVIRVFESAGIYAGPDFDTLTPYTPIVDEFGTTPTTTSDEIRITIEPSWSSGAQVCIRQSDPLPLTVCSMTLNVVVGD